MNLATKTIDVVSERVMLTPYRDISLLATLVLSHFLNVQDAAKICGILVQHNIS